MRSWLFVITVGSFLAGCTGLADLGAIDSVEALRAACDEHEVETLELDVFFPAVHGCEWGVGDNWDATSGVVAARSEQVAELEIPAGGVVCGLDFEFAGVDPGFEQVMEYDDHFLLNFNEVVLAASYGAMVDRFEASDGLASYDWTDLQGFPIELHEDVPDYCVGEDDGLSECTIPPSETPGAIALSFQGDLVDRLSFRALEAGEYTFGFVATGDDNDTDCSHEDRTAAPTPITTATAWTTWTTAAPARSRITTASSTATAAPTRTSPSSPSTRLCCWSRSCSPHDRAASTPAPARCSRPSRT